MVKILLLDDDELANELVVFILELSGIRDYKIFTSGNEALLYLESCKTGIDFPDIMFVDINMPGMNGFDFVNCYEKGYRKYSPDTRIIMLTNSVLANEKKLAAAHESVSDFWNKPLTHERLKQLIESVNSEKN